MGVGNLHDQTKRRNSRLKNNKISREETLFADLSRHREGREQECETLTKGEEMLHLNAPALIEIREGITLNLATSVSQAVERGLPLQRLKKEAEARVRAGERPKADDYETYGKADTVSFWFIGGTSLCYRVGEEITQKEFEKVAAVLKSLQYRLKDEREPSNDKSVKKA